MDGDHEQPVPAWHAIDASAAASVLETDSRKGLSGEEAARRLASYAENVLPEAEKRSLARLFLSQFQSPLIYILFIAAALALLLGKHGDALVILAVVFVNAVIGAFQEGRAERSMAALQRLSTVNVRVIRDGMEQTIESRGLVPGDLLALASGDAVAADALLTESVSLEAGEAALTGESLPVAKQTGVLPEETLLAERTNMVFSGTHITSGRGRALVVATGQASELGKIAELTTSAEEPDTPLQIRIAQFGRYLVAAALAMLVIVLGLGLLRGLPFTDIFMVAVSQMVSMVPEGLPVAMTIALAVGMQRMAARGAIVRRLSAVETLGSTSVICSDKTGTLTRNEMTVTQLWLPDERTITVSGSGYSPEGELREDGREVADDPAVRQLLEAVALCNDARLVPPDQEDPRWRALGDPTEAALITLAMKGGFDPGALDRNQPRRGEIPFDSASKMMATGHAGESGARQVYVKGAPEAVLELCGQAVEAGRAVPLDDTRRSRVLQQAEAMASQALRVLAVGLVPDTVLDPDAALSQLDGKVLLLGLVGQMDPPRAEMKATVEECQRAGIRPVMVTGDHKITGLAIARMLGIAREGDRAVDGWELEKMPEQELRLNLDHIAVFARVYPAQKLRIVEAFQSRRQVVAMTGDGVNDAPALARADVGVAMGITGTEVAKNAAKIVITDDNFSTIVNAVEEGRLVYRNLKKVILYLFATSMAEIAVLMLALLFGYPLPLAAVQILWINIVTEGTVTVNLIMEPPEGDEMRRPPVPMGEPLLSRALLGRIVLMTPAMALSTLGFFIWRLSSGVPFELVQTETFTVLAACQWFNVLNCQSETRSALRFGLIRNKWLLGGLILGILLQIAVVYTPALNALFHTVPIPAADYLLIIAAASLVLWVEEIRKLFARRRLRGMAAE
ncbi:MAG: HAD-IC family P-type ATPase [Thiobacillus sp.]